MDGWERENICKHQSFYYTYSPSLFVTIDSDIPVGFIEYSAVARNIHPVAGIAAAAVRRIVAASCCSRIVVVCLRRVVDCALRTHHCLGSPAGFGRHSTGSSVVCHSADGPVVLRCLGHCLVGRGRLGIPCHTRSA